MARQWHDVVPIGAFAFKKTLDILEHSPSLRSNIARMHEFAVLDNAVGARDR